MKNELHSGLFPWGQKEEICNCMLVETMLGLVFVSKQLVYVIHQVNGATLLEQNTTSIIHIVFNCCVKILRH